MPTANRRPHATAARRAATVARATTPTPPQHRPPPIATHTAAEVLAWCESLTSAQLVDVDTWLAGYFAPRIICGADEIATFLGVTWRTVYVWGERNRDPLPLEWGVAGGETGMWAHASALLAWRHRNTMPYLAHLREIDAARRGYVDATAPTRETAPQQGEPHALGGGVADSDEMQRRSRLGVVARRRKAGATDATAAGVREQYKPDCGRHCRRT